MSIQFPGMSRYRSETKLMLATAALFGISFFGIQMLLKVLYVLRLGYGPEYVGIYSSAPALTYMSMAVPSGAIGRKLGTRRTMLIGGIITGLGTALIPFSQFMSDGLRAVWPIAAQVILTCGWSMYNVNLVPALMSASSQENRNGAFALNQVLRNVGGLAGTLVGGFLPAMFASSLSQTLDDPLPYGIALWISAALSLVASLPLLRIPAQTPTIESAKPEQKTKPAGRFPYLAVGLIAGHVYFRHVGFACFRSFSSAYMDTTLALSPSTIGLITSVGQVMAIIAAMAMPRLSAQKSTGWVAMAATAAQAVALAAVALIPNWFGASIGVVGVQMLLAIWLPALQVFQMEMVDEQWRSMAYSGVSLGMGSGFGSLSLVGGFIAAAMGYRAVFWIGAASSVVSMLVMAFIERRRDWLKARSGA